MTYATSHRHRSRRGDQEVGSLAALVEAMPFAAAAGVELLEASPEAVVGRLGWAPERCTTAGVMHGGALMTLADSTAAVCAFLNLAPGTTTSTIESKTNFLRAVTEGDVEARTTPLHAGRSTVVLQTELRDAAGRRVAHVIQTQAIRTVSRP